MKEIGKGYSNYIREYSREHIGDIARWEKKIKQIVEPDKNEITKNRVADPNQDKAKLCFMMQPNVVEYLFQKGDQLFVEIKTKPS